MTTPTDTPTPARETLAERLASEMNLVRVPVPRHYKGWGRAAFLDGMDATQKSAAAALLADEQLRSVERLVEERDALRKALEFYADPDHWGFLKPALADEDGGRVARAALAPFADGGPR
jgi:hypothetical protein